MSQELINHSEDLKKLIDSGYSLIVDGTYALIDKIPYVNKDKNILYGTLVTNLTLTANKTIRPNTHVIYFIGEYPCNKDGTPILGIKHSSAKTKLTGTIIADHSFSNKPAGGYKDYFDKFEMYIKIISSPAISLKPNLSAKPYEVVQTQSNSPFNYYDTNSSRCEITAITENLYNQKVAIIGLGGTGSYVLDLVSKNPVQEIHLYDNDEFLQHNAFRSPGAPSIEDLRKPRKKTEYFKSIYEKMHKNIHIYNEFLKKDNIDKLHNIDFIFICIDNGSAKKDIIDYLTNNDKAFVDCGIGVDLGENSLIGAIRTTFSTPEKSDHIIKRIPLENTEDDIYTTNIQIAELNAMNAILAVIKWKKYLGVYSDFSKEHSTYYQIESGDLINDDFS